MKKTKNPVAVAMRKRYGKTQSVHRDKRLPRGGQKNEHRELLTELEGDLGFCSVCHQPIDEDGECLCPGGCPGL